MIDPKTIDFDALLERYRSKLEFEARRCVSIHRDIHIEYDDVLQECALVLWRCTQRFDSTKQTLGKKQRDPWGHFTGYLRRAVRNRLSNYVRDHVPSIAILTKELYSNGRPKPKYVPVYIERLHDPDRNLEEEA
jgi:DNA-directed RNA polymerase specialized sigma24 family protein